VVLGELTGVHLQIVTRSCIDLQHSTCVKSANSWHTDLAASQGAAMPGASAVLVAAETTTVELLAVPIRAAHFCPVPAGHATNILVNAFLSYVVCVSLSAVLIQRAGSA